MLGVGIICGILCGLLFFIAIVVRYEWVFRLPKTLEEIPNKVASYFLGDILVIIACLFLISVFFYFPIKFILKPISELSISESTAFSIFSTMFLVFIGAFLGALLGEIAVKIAAIYNIKKLSRENPELFKALHKVLRKKLKGLLDLDKFDF